MSKLSNQKNCSNHFFVEIYTGNFYKCVSRGSEHYSSQTMPIMLLGGYFSCFMEVRCETTSRWFSSEVVLQFVKTKFGPKWSISKIKMCPSQPEMIRVMHIWFSMKHKSKNYLLMLSAKVCRPFSNKIVSNSSAALQYIHWNAQCICNERLSHSLSTRKCSCNRCDIATGHFY